MFAALKPPPVSSEKNVFLIIVNTDLPKKVVLSRADLVVFAETSDFFVGRQNVGDDV